MLVFVATGKLVHCTELNQPFEKLSIPLVQKQCYSFTNISLKCNVSVVYRMFLVFVFCELFWMGFVFVCQISSDELDVEFFQ